MDHYHRCIYNGDRKLFTDSCLGVLGMRTCYCMLLRMDDGCFCYIGTEILSRSLQLGKITIYIIASLALFICYFLIRNYTDSLLILHLSSAGLILLFLLLVLRAEKNELRKMPFIGRYI